MPLTCNAVGDVLALIQLAIDIARFVADYRHAPSECRALLQDLRSMERLLALAQPTILAIKDAALKEATAERLRIVSQRVQDALNLVVKFRSAFDNAPVDPRSKWRATIVKWVTKQSEKVAWALKRNGDAEACRVAIAQSFEPLTLALLLCVPLPVLKRVPLNCHAARGTGIKRECSPFFDNLRMISRTRFSI